MEKEAASLVELDVPVLPTTLSKFTRLVPDAQGVGLMRRNAIDFDIGTP